MNTCDIISIVYGRYIAMSSFVTEGINSSQISSIEISGIITDEYSISYSGIFLSVEMEKPGYLRSPISRRLSTLHHHAGIIC